MDLIYANRMWCVQFSFFTISLALLAVPQAIKLVLADLCAARGAVPAVRGQAGRVDAWCVGHDMTEGY